MENPVDNPKSIFIHKLSTVNKHIFPQYKFMIFNIFFKLFTYLFMSYFYYLYIYNIITVKREICG